MCCSCFAAMLLSVHYSLLIFCCNVAQCSFCVAHVFLAVMLLSAHYVLLKFCCNVAQCSLYVAQVLL